MKLFGEVLAVQAVEHSSFCGFVLAAGPISSLFCYQKFFYTFGLTLARHFV
jgi:hypothetical protein